MYQHFGQIFAFFYSRENYCNNRNVCLMLVPSSSSFFFWVYLFTVILTMCIVCICRSFCDGKSSRKSLHFRSPLWIGVSCIPISIGLMYLNRNFFLFISSKNVSTFCNVVLLLVYLFVSNLPWRWIWRIVWCMHWMWWT